MKSIALKSQEIDSDRT